MDETDLYNKFKKARFDLDFGENITKQLFLNHFTSNGVEEEIAQQIYDSIESESNDYLTATEFFQWQRKQCTKRLITEILSMQQTETKSDAEPSENQQQTQEPQEPQQQQQQQQEAQQEQEEEEQSKSYSIKFDLYEDDKETEESIEKKEEDLTDIIIFKDDESQSLQIPDEALIYMDHIDIPMTPSSDKITTKPGKISADFMGYIEAHSPKTPSKKGTYHHTKSHSDSVSAKKNKPVSTPASRSRVDNFLNDESEDDESADDEEEIEMLQKQQKKFRCLDCLCYLMFLIIFTGMAIFSIGSGDSNYTQSASIRKSLVEYDQFYGWNINEKTGEQITKKRFDDISTIQDIYHYMRQILIPFLLSDDREVNGTIIHYVQSVHILMGGIRIRQIRLKPLQCEFCANYTLFGECGTSDDDDIFDDTDCYDEDEINKETVYFYGSEMNDSDITEGIGYEYIDSSVLLDQRYQGKFNGYPGGGYIEDLPLNLNESMDIIDILENIKWIDASTLFVSVDFTTYNPSKSLHTVVRLMWEMPTSGIFSNDEVKTWKFDRYYGKTTGFILFVIHIIFIMFVFVLTGAMIIDICRHYINNNDDEYKDEKKKNKKKKFWNRWRILDIMILLLFYVTIGLFVHNERYQKGLIDIFNWKPPYQSFRRLQALSQTEAYCFALNGFLLWFKLFKFLGFHPKFKFLFFMLQRGLQDIMMFIILLFIFYLAFAICGFIVFGGDIEEYRTYGLSIVSMNRFMITEMNYTDLVASASIFGSIYYFSWLIWMTFILINVFIAILIDSYSKTQVEIELDGYNAVRFNVFDKGREYVKQLKFAQIMSRFDAINQDGDDYIDAEEIAKGLDININDANKIIMKYDKDGNGLLDRNEFEKLKQKIIRDKMNEKPNYRELKEYDTINEQVIDLKDLINKMLAIDPIGKRALKQRNGIKYKRTSTTKLLKTQNSNTRFMD